uniref:EF-hand domain-containing protein n=1 Tax=Chlamydomonas euryale TaxID=1486919 RepID=A0A7R9VWN3_9CHLO|mmetsp:Transcript_5678/g.17313  ORF Transcript_5678/g.17313 Transcript_5678/m.17313 type:complete len:449 (+) Transcript_5678:260-1606(+)
MAGDSLAISSEGDSLFDEGNASAEFDSRGGGAGRGPAGKPASHVTRPAASPPGGSGGDGSFDEADIDDLFNEEDEDSGGGGGGSKPEAPRMAGNTAAGPAAAARTAAAGNANLVDDGDVDDNDDLDLSESGEEEHPKASPFVEAARAPMHTPKPTPPLAGELSAAGLATPGGGLSEAGDYSVDGESYGSPTKTPGAESSVNFAAASGRQGGGGGGAAISVEDFGGGGSAAGAAARFKAMDDRRAAAAGRGPAEKPPVLPKLADVEAADLDYEDKEMGLELPSPLQLFLQYDTDRTGGINVHEFAQMLYDLDGLDDLQAKENAKMRAHIAKEFDRADLNNDELISIDEFYMYFYSTLCFKFPVVRSGINPGADLLNIYMRYCSIGKSERTEQMNAYNFMKLCMHSKLVNGTSMKQAMCDIIWFRARAELESLEAWKRKGNEFITPKVRG